MGRRRLSDITFLNEASRIRGALFFLFTYVLLFGDVAAVSGGTTGCIPFRGLLLGFVGRIGLLDIY